MLTVDLDDLVCFIGIFERDRIRPHGKMCALRGVLAQFGAEPPVAADPSNRRQRGTRGQHLLNVVRLPLSLHTMQTSAPSGNCTFFPFRDPFNTSLPKGTAEVSHQGCPPFHPAWLALKYMSLPHPFPHPSLSLPPGGFNEKDLSSQGP